MSLVKKRMPICNFVCVILLVAIVVIQLCVPFYTYYDTVKIEGKNTEVISQATYGGFVWFPKEDAYEGLANHFKAKDMFGSVDKFGNEYARGKKFNLDEMAYPHLYTVILTGFSLVFFLMKRKSFVPSALSMAAGIITIKAFLTNRTIVLGPQYAHRVVNNSTVCTINVILGIALICVAAFSLFGGFVLKPLAKKKAAKVAEA